MARKKKSMIGIDPLAWLADDIKGEKNHHENDELVNADEKNSSPKLKTEKKELLGQAVDINSLVKGYDLVKDALQPVVNEFFPKLFEQCPEMAPLFSGTNESEQADKFSSAIQTIFEHLEDENFLKDFLKDMGERHQEYGAEVEQFNQLASILIATCKQHVGRSWTKKVTAAWESLFNGVAETMVSAYKLDESSETEEISKQTGTEAAKSNVLVLESIQDISKSELLKQEMMALIKDSSHIEIDASEVVRVDGSALQLLCGLFEYAKVNNIELAWVNPSDAMLSSVEYLGLKKLLNLN